MIFFRRNREKTPLEIIREDLKRKLTADHHNPKLTKEEKAILEQIRKQTTDWNKNNLMRTKAYLNFYQQHPEIHWAFLGHMVSRNGGWNMTDLKGELLSSLLSNKEKRSFFTFLERGNWLIFQDTFPQFLLFQESLQRNKPFFYLFSFLNISKFMETIWTYFWNHPNTWILTIALIVNEQSYLEKRVVQNPLYKNEVFNKLEFKLQDFLSFNHILFPGIRQSKIHITGQTLHHFDSLHERILLGKRLYTVLFKNKETLKDTEEWAICHPHTGSRKDYWPHLFNHVRESLPDKSYQLRLKSCQLKEGASRIFSPNLESVWKNVSHVEAERGDWFNDLQVMDYFVESDEAIDGEIENEYCKTLERLELAALAKKAIPFWD